MSIWLPSDRNAERAQARWTFLASLDEGMKATEAQNVVGRLQEAAGDWSIAGCRGVPNPWARAILTGMVLKSAPGANEFSAGVQAAWKAGLALMILGRRVGDLEVIPLKTIFERAGLKGGLNSVLIDFLAEADPGADPSNRAILQFRSGRVEVEYKGVVGLIGGPNLIVPGASQVPDKARIAGIHDSQGRLHWNLAKLASVEHRAILAKSLLDLAGHFALEAQSGRAAPEDMAIRRILGEWLAELGPAVDCRLNLVRTKTVVPRQDHDLGAVGNVLIAPSALEPVGPVDGQPLPFRVVKGMRVVGRDKTIQNGGTILIHGGHYEVNSAGEVLLGDVGTIEGRVDVGTLFVDHLVFVPAAPDKSVGRLLKCGGRSTLYPFRPKALDGEWIAPNTDKRVARDHLITHTGLLANEDGSYTATLDINVPGDRDRMLRFERRYQFGQQVDMGPDRNGMAPKWATQGIYLWPDFESDDWHEYFFGEYGIVPDEQREATFRPLGEGEAAEEETKSFGPLRWWQRTRLSAVEVARGGEWSGLILLQPRRVTAPMQGVNIVGVDFGSTHTTVAVMPQIEGVAVPLDFAYRVSHVGGRCEPRSSKVDEDYALQLRLFGLEPAANPEPVALLNTVFWDGVGATDLPFAAGVQFQGKRTFPKHLLRKPFLGPLVFSLKWGSLDVGPQRVKFLRQLWLLIRAELCDKRYRLGDAQSVLRVAAPSCMSRNDRRLLCVDWKAALGLAENPVVASEAEAVRYYLGEPDEGVSYGVGVDVGGSTTDVSVFHLGSYDAGHSFRIAGGSSATFLLFSEKLSRDLGKATGFEFFDDKVAPIEWQLAAALREAGGFELADNGAEGFLGIVTVQYALAAYVSGLAFASYLRRNSDHEPDARPALFDFVGYGARLFDLAAQGLDANDPGWLAKVMIEHALRSTAQMPANVRVRFEPHRQKMEVALGLCRMPPPGQAGDGRDIAFHGERSATDAWYETKQEAPGPEAYFQDLFREFSLGLTSAATTNEALRKRLEGLQYGSGGQGPGGWKEILGAAMTGEPPPHVLQGERAEPRALTVAWIEIASRAMAAARSGVGGVIKLRARRFGPPVKGGQ